MAYGFCLVCVGGAWSVSFVLSLAEIILSSLCLPGGAAGLLKTALGNFVTCTSWHRKSIGFSRAC